MIPGLTINPTSIQFVISNAIQDDRVGRICCKKLKPEYLYGPGEEGLRIIWSSVIDFYNEYGYIPGYNALATTVVSRLESGELDDTPLAEETLDRLEYIFDNEETDPAYAEKLCQLIISRYFKYKTEYTIGNMNGDAESFNNFLSEVYNEYSSAANFCSHPVNNLIPTDITELGRHKRSHPIGLSFFDRITEGGGQLGEVYVLLGPTGGGKSILSLQICTTGASLAANNPGDPVYDGWNVYFSYEMPEKDIMQRAVAQAARIPFIRIKDISQGLANFAGPEDSPSYEQELFGDNIFVPCERERYIQAIDTLNNNFRIVDFSGNSQHGGVTYGYGGIEEIVDYLKELEDSTGRPIRTIVIDWVGAMIQKQAIANNADISKIYTPELNSFVNRVQSKISIPFNCMVWSVHQLSPSVAKTKPGKSLHHSDAAYCKSFAEYAWFAFTLGTQDRETGALVLSCTKARRASPKSTRPVVLKIDDTVSFVDASDEFYFDSILGAISSESF